MVNNSSRLGVPSVRYTVPDEAEAPQTDSDVRLYPGSRVAARLLSIGMLCSVFALFGSVGFSVSQALHDSFVAPTILSPDSDLVIASKLKLIELAVERARATAELEGIDSDVGADTQGLARLDELRGKLESAVQWTSEITTQKVVAGSRELKDLAQQRELVGAMVEEQRKLTENAHADVGAGVISRADYARQTQSLTEFQLALLENERSTLQSKAALLETALAQRALAGSGGAPIMPELMMNEEQSIRVELETMRLEADKRSKLAARTAVIERIDKIDELSSEMRRRPVYRAIERSLDVAFVPY